MKVKILKTVTANVGGHSVRMEADVTYDVPTEVAEMLKAGGYAEGTRAAAKVQVKPKGKPLNSKSVKAK